jgi:hypothetical protein
MPSKQVERLGEAIATRRSALGLTHAELAAASGGVGSSTLRQAENARQPGGLSKKTLTGIDRALRWKPGSAGRILRGTAMKAEPLDIEGWPTIGGDWSAYVARRIREDEDAHEVAAGARTAQKLARLSAHNERRMAVSEFSDAELFAELARRLGEARRAAVPPTDRAVGARRDRG